MRPHDPPPLAEPPPDHSGLSVEAQRRLTSEYRPWRKLRYIAEELGVDPIAAWTFVKARRRHAWRELPLARHEGGNFGLCHHPGMARPLFLIDRASGDDLIARGARAAFKPTVLKRLSSLFGQGETLPSRLQVKTAMFEAAESSIIEGASATREQALDLLRSGRAPKSVGERMILNNHHAMALAKQRLAEPLSLDLLLELQSIVTAGTLDQPDASGRFRTASEDVRVVDTRDGSTIHTPPPADRVVPMLRQVCDFANTNRGTGDFLHPIVAASILHFLVGYVHPFVDGNGRTARAIFYWCALRHGYALFEFLSISEIIRKGFARYPQAFVDAVTDEGDLTYFILYHLDVIEQALDRFAEHLRREEQKIERSERLLRIAKGLNLRQRLLLEHAIRHPATEYTVKSHSNSNGITLMTARTDLDALVRLRLMTTSKRVREVIYHVSPTLKPRLARKGL